MDSRESAKLAPQVDGDVVLLMGTGASAFLGLPTLDTILDNEVSSGSSEQARIIWKTRNAVRAESKIGKAVFEEVISKLREYEDMALKLHSEYPFRDELGQLPHDVDAGTFLCKWKNALTECYRILLRACGPEEVDTSSPAFETTVKFFDQLATLNSGSLHVYTTNYDCSLQVLAANSGTLPFFSQIAAEDGTFDGHWHPAGRRRRKRRLSGAYVHRLHGCIAWFHNEKKPYSIQEVSGAGKRLEINDDEKLHRMAIKLVTSQLVGINPAFLLSFNQFEDHLSSAKALIVWGYSFRDVEVLRTVNSSLWLRQSPFPIYSLNPFLSESEIVDNIRWTLRDVPIKLHPDFKPQKIDWKPSDGYGALIENSINNVEIQPKCLRRKKRLPKKGRKLSAK